MGEFKDYNPIVADLHDQLSQRQKPDIGKLSDILSAEFDDIEHIPNFQKMLTLLFQQPLDYLEPKMQRQLVILVLRIMQSNFTSYSVDEDLVQHAVAFLNQQLAHYQPEAIEFFLYMSLFASYAENHEQLVLLFLGSIKEELAFQHEETLEKYMRIVDKFLRNITLRNIFKAKLNEKMEK